MAISRRQSVAGSSGTSSTTSPTATWPSATLAGSLLVCGVYHENSSSITLTGWTLAISLAAPTAGTISLYYKPSAASESGTVTATLGTATNGVMFLAEYTGADVSPLDQTASASNASSSTTHSSGTTATTTNANEVCVTLITGSANSSAPTAYSSPTNSFSEVAENPGHGGTWSAVLHDRIVSATGTYGHNVTASNATRHAGIIATFKEATLAAAVPLLLAGD